MCRDYEEPIDLFDRHLYEKGGLVLHMLRRELGDETFWRGVNRYLVRHAGGIVETNDLMRALEEVSGRSLERFFDQWVYRPGHPELKVKICLGGRPAQRARQADAEDAATTRGVRVRARDRGGEQGRQGASATRSP